MAYQNLRRMAPAQFFALHEPAIMLFSGVLQRARLFPNHNPLKAMTVTFIFLNFLEFAA
ncbi:hypothetical protein [Limnohabitans sp. Rim28]|uniref:hypothetical protein n=1 Tax=Limnohabitans sp. Rim28 TaxID=1100720 RepID=UPI001300813F|nr:hypothetical protein [Limnohabitans sp. Rim28]